MRIGRTPPPAGAVGRGRHEPVHCAGSSLFSPEAWKRLAESLRLSDRQLQIVLGSFDDKTESAMAADLRISPSTVPTHVERLHHKLAVADRSQLVLRVTQEFMALTATPGSGLPPICANRGSYRCPHGT